MSKPQNYAPSMVSVPSSSGIGLKLCAASLSVFALHLQGALPSSSGISLKHELGSMFLDIIGNSFSPLLIEDQSQSTQARVLIA